MTMHPQKRLAPLACTVAALTVAQTLLGQTAYDGFGGGPLATIDGSTGGYGWAGAWTDSASSQLTSVGGSGLAYPGLMTTPGAAATPVGGSFDAANFYRALPAFPAGTDTVYISFLIRPDDWSSYGGLAIGSYPRNIFFGYTMGMYSLGIRCGRYVFEQSTAQYAVGRTDLVVVEIAKTATTTTYRLFVDPTVGAGRPAFPNAEYTWGADPLPQWLTLSNDGGFTTDELRVSTTWAGAVPPAAPSCAADLGRQGGIAGSDGTLDNNDFAVFINYFFSADPRADFGIQGGVPGQDGHFDNNDFIVFVDRFFSGC